MFSARWSVRAVALLFVLSLCSLSARAQAVRFPSLQTRSLPSTGMRLAAEPCLGSSGLFPALLSEELSTTDSSLAGCDGPSISPKPAIPALAIAPCAVSSHSSMGCAPTTDAVRDDLNTMGKPGRKILQAREKILEILQSENACSAWYRTKDADPAATFRTLTFALDNEGDVYVRKSTLSGGINLFHSPYVARVLQGGGPQSTVTINTNGGFFFPLTGVVEQGLDGGPMMVRGARPLQVGPYAGGTPLAQVLTILHEFGHVIDLLPLDYDDHEGRSRQNTEEALHFCRAQIETKGTPHSLLASR